MYEKEIRITDDLDKLLDIIPPVITGSLKKMKNVSELIEVVMDLGRKPEARFEQHFTYLSEEFVTKEDINYVVKRIGKFGDDNRAGIERTLHRISAIKNRTDDIIGLTMRVGRAVYGTIHIIRDLLETEESILLLGRPGIGKTTMLREIARVLADDLKKRVVVVDTSNEIAGDGDIPHTGIGLARRMQVPKHDMQHEVMIEAVQNHMPEVIVVDEIGTEKEAYAARTIAERGVQLIATAHGNSLENLLMNPTISDLIGGIQAVTLSDEVARKRGTQKTVLERKAPPTFDILVEIVEKESVAIHRHVDQVVDMKLRGVDLLPEIRVRDDHNGYKVVQQAGIGNGEHSIDRNGGVKKNHESKFSGSSDITQLPEKRPLPGSARIIKIFPYAVSKNRIDKAIEAMNVNAQVVRRFEDADIILTIKSQLQRGPRKLREMAGNQMPIHSIRSNTVTQIQNFLRDFFQTTGENSLLSSRPMKENHLYHRQENRYEEEMEETEQMAMIEAEEGIKKAAHSSGMIELSPQSSYIRRLQHTLIEKHNLISVSYGREPYRRIRIYNDKL